MTASELNQVRIFKLACPFCGSPNMKQFSYPDDDHIVQCLCCGTIGPSGKTLEEAITKWNTRIKHP